MCILLASVTRIEGIGEACVLPGASHTVANPQAEQLRNTWHLFHPTRICVAKKDFRVYTNGSANEQEVA